MQVMSQPVRTLLHHPREHQTREAGKGLLKTCGVGLMLVSAGCFEWAAVAFILEVF